VIGALALIVVGPRDLPKLLRTLGQQVGRIRGMAREFQRSMDEAAREADLGDLKELRQMGSDIRKATEFDFKEQARKTHESLTKAANPLTEFEKVKKDPPAAEETAEPEPEPAPEPVAEETAAAKPAPAPAEKS
ncbi:MAG: twin-arginine translocase subunit TatB, partial [Pseudomonadota bacterium]